jgi:hypothetical protein
MAGVLFRESYDQRQSREKIAKSGIGDNAGSAEPACRVEGRVGPAEKRPQDRAVLAF